MAIGSTGFSFLGIGKETTKGTAVAASEYIKATSFDGDDTVDVLLDQGMRGVMATTFGAVKGTTQSSFSIEGDVHVDTIGYFLNAIMGGYAVSGAGTYTHTFSLLNSGTGQCQSYTLHDYNGLQARKYAASTESSLSLRFSAQELLTYSSSWSGFLSVTETTPSPTFSTLPPIAGWVGSVSLDGSANSLLEECDITLSRNVTPVFTIDGTQDPSQVWQGPISASGRLMFLADAETQFTNYTSVADPGPLVLTFAQGTASLVLTMTSIVYTQAKVERGDDFTQVSAQFEGIANTTDVGASGGYSPIKPVLINSVATYA